MLEEGSALAKCPQWLTGDAKELWERVVPGAIRCGLLTLVDIPAFEALCRTYGKWREAERKIEEVGLELAIAKGFQNASVKERQLLRQFGQSYGFDPSSRSAVKLPHAKPRNAADMFRAAKAGA
jgi:P27 family predicted phage terminase small subunit